MQASTPHQVKISQAAEFLGISIKTLRRWEKKGLVKPDRDQLNQRVYTRSDLEKLSQKESTSPEKEITNGHHLTISQAAELLDVSVKSLRRWDNQGKITVPRNQQNHRIFTKDCIVEIRQLLRDKQSENGFASISFQKKMLDKSTYNSNNSLISAKKEKNRKSSSLITTFRPQHLLIALLFITPIVTLVISLRAMNDLADQVNQLSATNQSSNNQVIQTQTPSLSGEVPLNVPVYYYDINQQSPMLLQNPDSFSAIIITNKQSLQELNLPELESPDQLIELN